MSDLISRADLKKALKGNCDLCHDKNTNWCEHCCPLNDFEDLIDNAPIVMPDMEFAKWVTKMIFDNGVEDFDFELFSELACRKLEKLGLVKKTESEWIKKGGAE